MKTHEIVSPDGFDTLRLTAYGFRLSAFGLQIARSRSRGPAR